SLRTSTLSTRDLVGHVSTADVMRERATRMFDSWKPPIQARFTLGVIDVRGCEAVATVRQELSRMQMVGDHLRRIDTKVTQDETWVRPSPGWKLNFVDNERDLLWCVDGKKVKPGVPYDPAAPPYDPHHGSAECKLRA